MVSDESGDEVELSAASVQCRLAQPNTEELSRFLSRARMQYEHEHQASSTALNRLQVIQELLHEQLRRLEVKAAAHSPGTTAGVLYAQNIQFLQRLLGETEA